MGDVRKVHAELRDKMRGTLSALLEERRDEYERAEITADKFCEDVSSLLTFFLASFVALSDMSVERHMGIQAQALADARKRNTDAEKASYLN